MVRGDKEEEEEEREMSLHGEEGKFFPFALVDVDIVHKQPLATLSHPYLVPGTIPSSHPFIRREMEWLSRLKIGSVTLKNT
jgi:hypothetical protein